MSITTTELAKLAGVSRATVDRVLNQRGKVKPETEAKILSLAKEHHYRTNHIARSLSTGKTHSIGLIIPNVRNSFFATLLDAVTIESMKRGYTTLVQLYQDSPQNEVDCIYNLYDRNVDGILLFSMQPEASAKQLLDSLNLPVVSLCNTISNYSYAGPHYHSAISDAVYYIANHHYKKIIYVSPPLEYENTQNMNAMVSRYEGFLDAISKTTLDYEVLCDSHYLATLTTRNIEDFRDTAILCSNDIYALKLLNTFHNKGIKIPKDLGLMGFDNIDMLAYIQPQLTTVGIDLNELGKKALDILLATVEGNATIKDSIIPHTIFAGNTLNEL